jgi:hypothetical protein
MGTRIVKDAATGRFFRLAHNNHEVQHSMTFAEAVDDLNSLVKSKRARAESVQQLSDDKDYMESNADDFDRRAVGPRRPDMRSSWRGIQAYYAEKFAAQEEELDELEHAMLVSGRRAKIRFPGAKGDSTLEPFELQDYVEDDGTGAGYEGRDYIEERNAAIRGGLGGDALSWRSQATRRGTGEDAYASGKSLRRDILDPRCLVKGSREYDMLKSRVCAAIFDEQADPELGMILDSYDPRHQTTRYNIVRALANIAPEVRRRYGIPSAPPAVEAAFRGQRGSGQGLGHGLSY